MGNGISGGLREKGRSSGEQTTPKLLSVRRQNWKGQQEETGSASYGACLKVASGLSGPSRQHTLPLSLLSVSICVGSHVHEEDPEIKAEYNSPALLRLKRIGLLTGV